MDFSSTELLQLRERGIVLFEDRIIRDARPPITDDVLERIAARCSGPLPDGLITLWRTTFGGRLDYTLEVQFGSIIAHPSFSEIFYAGSDGYKDLWGWIEHESELSRDRAKRNWTGKLDYLPFGGFEYGTRLYVCVAPGPDHGTVSVWERGLPSSWRLRLHHDAVAPVGPDVASLFRRLAFEDDPRAPTEKHAAGTHLVELIRAIDEPLQAKLLAHVGRSVLEWRGAIENATIASNPQLLRLALRDIATRDDVASLDRLAELGCDLGMQVIGGGTAIDLALVRDATKVVRSLLDRGVPVANGIKHASARIDVALVDALLARGATPDVSAAIEAARARNVGAALAIARAVVKSNSSAKSTLITEARRAATSAERSALDLEKRPSAVGNASEHRASAMALLELIARIERFEPK